MNDLLCHRFPESFVLGAPIGERLKNLLVPHKILPREASPVSIELEGGVCREPDKHLHAP